MNQAEELRAWMEALYQPLLVNPPAPPPGPPDDALPVGQDPLSRDPLWITLLEMLTSAVVLGASGTAKSTWFRYLLTQLVALKQRCGDGFIVFDPHGSLCRWALQYIALVAPELAGDVYYYDFRQKHGKALQLGLLSGDKERAYLGACLSVEAILKGSGSANVMDKPTLTRALQNSCQGAIELDLSASDLRWFLQSGPNEVAVRHALLDRLPVGHPVRSFFDDLSAKSPNTQDTYAVGCLNRTDFLERTKAIARTQCHPGVDFEPAMDGGWIIFVDGGIEGTDVTIDHRNTVFAMLANKVLATFDRREPDRSRPFTVIADEVPDYLGSAWARAIQTVRKRGGRPIFSAQTLESLIPKDRDLSLLQAVLSIPTKLIFGGLPLSEARLLAENCFLQLIDPAQIKFQRDELHWDPDVQKVVLRSRSTGGSTTKTEGTATTHGSGRTATRTRSSGTGGSRHSEADGTTESWNDGTGESESETENDSTTENSSFATTRSWSESATEAWVNFPKPRWEKSIPIYASLDEQVFAFAKKLRLQPRGLAVLCRGNELPRDLGVPYMRDFEFDDEAIQPFIDEMMDKPEYRCREDLDRFLEDRPRQLLETAQPQPIIGNSESETPRPRQRARRRRFEKPR